MDLNDFKGVNDNFGHFVGDEVLIEVAEVLKKLFLIRGEVGRYGGDKFLCGITKVSKDVVIELDSKQDLKDYFLKLDENLYIAKKSTQKKYLSLRLNRLQ